jgi:hypothetical protein
MSDYSKDDYKTMARRRKVALMTIAEKLGTGHPVTKMMRSIAWGRCEVEVGGHNNTLRGAIEWKAFLDGEFWALRSWACINVDKNALRVLIDEYPHNYEKAKP